MCSAFSTVLVMLRPLVVAYPSPVQLHDWHAEMPDAADAQLQLPPRLSGVGLTSVSSRAAASALASWSAALRLVAAHVAGLPALAARRGARQRATPAAAVEFWRGNFSQHVPRLMHGGTAGPRLCSLVSW